MWCLGNALDCSSNPVLRSIFWKTTFRISMFTHCWKYHERFFEDLASQEEIVNRTCFSDWYNVSIRNLDLEFWCWVLFQKCWLVRFHNSSQFGFWECTLYRSCVQKCKVHILFELERNVKHSVCFVQSQGRCKWSQFVFRICHCAVMCCLRDVSWFSWAGWLNCLSSFVCFRLSCHLCRFLFRLFSSSLDSSINLLRASLLVRGCSFRDLTFLSSWVRSHFRDRWSLSWICSCYWV